LTLAYVLAYGTQNQATYLLDPLHRAMPELFRRDWFVSGTPPYLPVFGWLAQWLYVIDPEGVVAFVTAHIVITLASWAAVYWLVRAVGAGVRTFVIVASFAALTMNVSMGGSYLITGYFQPSSLAALGWLVAIAALVRDRFVLCGIAAALAGLLHANFLVLGIGLFGLASLARRDLGWRELAFVMVPQLVVLACFLPQLLAAAGPSKHAVWILTHFHAPVHYDPVRMIGWIKDVVGWQVGAFAGLYLIGDNKAARTLWRFSLVAAVIVTLSALVVQLAPLEWLVQVRWSRIAPFGQLACVVLIVAGIGEQVRNPRDLSTRQRILVGLGLVAPLYVVSYHIRVLAPLVAFHVAALTCVLVLSPWPRIARSAFTVLAVAAFTFALWRSPRGEGLRQREAAPPKERELAAWARTQTPTDALFVTPPGVSYFRLLARRAVIVDSKSPPLRPDLLEQWHARLSDVVLDPDPRTFQAAAASYAKLSPAQLEQVAHKYDADYIVVRGHAPFAAPPVFDNGVFAVYRVSR
jgi:hypothetical protein